MIRTHDRSRKTAPLAAAIVLALTALLPIASMASEEVDKGPVWRTWTARVHEEKLDAYLDYLTKVYKYKLAAWKAAGLITDYKIVVADQQSETGPNIFFMYQYKNMAALDAPEELWEKAGKQGIEKITDPDAKKLINVDYHPWRTFTGWTQTSREVDLK